MMSLTNSGRFLLNYGLNFVSAIPLIGVSKILFRRYPISGLALTISNSVLSTVFATIVLIFISKPPPNSQTSTNRLQAFLRMLFISGTFTGFITFSNLSLQYNPIGTYQIMKLQIPLILMVIEYIQLQFGFNSALLTKEKFHRDYSTSVLYAFAIIAIGSTLSICFDRRFHLLGFAFAGISILFNALYQAQVQGDQVSSTYERMRFLQIQTFISLVLLCPGWPFLDNTFEYNKYLFTRWDALCLLFLCGFLAFLVNLSVIWCIKDVTTIRFNMVGQLKTFFLVGVLSIFFGESITFYQIGPILFTTGGCIYYAYSINKNEEYYKHQARMVPNNI
ncbi:unnamed protein product [Adineta steineri]|uniref:Sugar phosphate transporter domain-containing protein n=2 Tax=Adineta steineri TaxID=433720 RepID=A0A814KGF8_9BILA|nr:unnamed protein product [Adineta steineri]CAF3925947.1 unnamed protein product [Adineta steineri]